MRGDCAVDGERERTGETRARLREHVERGLDHAEDDETRYHLREALQLLASAAELERVE
jgi:hypothetical protein